MPLRDRLLVGGVTCERLRSEIMGVLQQHYRRVGFNPELGDGFSGDDEAERQSMQDQAKYQQRRFFRIPFGIARPGMMLAAIQSHKVEIEVIHKKLSECVVIDKYASGDADAAFDSTISYSDLPTGHTLRIQTGRLRQVRGRFGLHRVLGP